MKMIPLHASSTQVIEEPAFFLDSVPPELFDIVLRFLSRLPNSQNWETHTDLEDILHLYGVVGELGQFLKGRFKALCISRKIGRADEENNSQRNLRARPLLWTDNIDVARSFILAGGGESLRTLIVGPNIYDEDHHGTEIVDEFLSSCPNLTSLSIDERGSAWSDRFQNQLKKAKVASEPVPAFRPHCPALRELTLHSTSHETSFADLWMRIGCNLESLTLSKQFNLEYEIENIHEYCPNLRRISAECRNDVLYSELLALYGNQLDYIHLYSMSDSQIRFVAEACTNACFHLTNFGGVSATALNILGPRLDKVRTAGFEIWDDHIDWKGAWDTCINLRELEVCYCDLVSWEAIMGSPKEHLKVLKINVVSQYHRKFVKKILDMCAKGTSSVQKFTFHGPAIYRDGLENFIEKNRSYLSSVQMYKNCDNQDEELGELTEMFLKLPGLQELRFDFKISEENRAILKNRGVHCYGE